MLSKPILSYQGPFSFSTIDLLLSEFKIAATEQELPFRTYKRMICIMIEALENLTKYSDQIGCNGTVKNGFCPSCFINCNTKQIELITRNQVKNKDVEPLRQKIDRVNGRNQEELKALYRSIISNGKFSSRGGAGLGFIEMAKTTGNHLEYHFEQLGKGYSLYTFRVVMNL